jgi:nucleoside phosphorylase
MSLRKDYFLEQFDSTFRGHIVEFGKKLTELSKNYDLLIFLARKAACLADSLEELGLAQFHCMITSSRILDMKLDWLEGKKIAIVDDALISGTTIFENLRRLSKHKDLKADVLVLSVDLEWWKEDLVQPLPSYFKLNSQQTSLICSNIVNAIAVVPRPYTIDYPLFKNVRFKERDFQDIASSADWLVYESTSSHQERYKITNLTIVPSDAATVSFFSNLGLDVSRDFLLKIRLYALRIDDVYWCQIQPIVILPPLTADGLERMFAGILETSGDSSIKSWFLDDGSDDSLKSKLRFVQYYCGLKLAEKWFGQISNRISSKIQLEQDIRNISFLFPPLIRDSIYQLAYASTARFDLPDGSFTYQIQQESEQPDDEDFDEAVALYRLSKPFLYLFQEKELRARRLVKEHGIAVFENDEYKQTIDRLNQGFSINDLKKFVGKVNPLIDKDRLVSYFLDLYIDKGAVVPITYINNGMIFRAFRHGEDVEFSENEMRLCAAMLEKFVSEYRSDELPHTVLEKILVLFIRIGVEQDFLTISSKPLSDYATMGIRYYLHGAVVGPVEKNIYKVDINRSLTRVLLEAGYLERKVFKDRYKVKTPIPNTGVDLRGLAKAKQVGLVLGALLCHESPKISNGDLILMATCPNLVDVVGAMAAEIYIFQSFFQQQGYIFFKQFSDTSSVDFLKFRSHKAHTALNSGTWKFENFQNGTPWEVIQKSEILFENELYSEVWKSFWPSTGKETSESAANPHLLQLSDKLASWLYISRFYINMAELALFEDHRKFIKSKAFSENQNILDKISEKFPDLHSEFTRAFDQAVSRSNERTLKRQVLYDFSMQKVSENFHVGRQLLPEVDALASNFGRIDRIVYYDHAVILDIKQMSQPYAEIMKRIRDVIDSTRIEAKKGERCYIFEIPKQYSAIKTGLLLCASGHNSRKWLLRLIERISNSVGQLAIFKSTFFFHLDTLRIIRNITSNQFHAPLFWDVAKELLKAKSKQNRGHELVYFTTSEANRDAIEDDIRQECSDFKELSLTGKRTTKIEEPIPTTFRTNHFIKSMQTPVKNVVDVGIITVITQELSAVVDYFSSNGSLREERSSESRRTFYHGKISDKNNKALDVVAIQAWEQGNRSVISAYNALSEEFNPRFIVLLGVAGSVHEKVNVGDVVIGEFTTYYDKRAITDKGVQHRLDPYKINAFTREFVRRFHLSCETDEPSFPSKDTSLAPSFNCYFGGIASGEAVIKHEEADVRNWLNQQSDRIYAVETEAAGVTQQFFEDEIRYSRHAQGLLILRGISDRADVAKNDKWKLAASMNAVKILEAIFKANYLD